MNKSIENEIDWSVVVIARNEEAVIANCLDSVVRAFQQRSYELIFVDSASTDRTVEIVRRFDARIITIPAVGPLRPSVGRYIGYRYVKGKWILFLDGDSVLDASWVEAAERAFSSDASLGGLSGERENAQLAPDGSTILNKRVYPLLEYESADQLDGPAAYRKDVFAISGGFNPFFYGTEEAELGARIRKVGFRLCRLKQTMTQHFIKHSGETVSELFRRLRRKYSIGDGQFVRHIFAYRLPVREPFALISRYIQFFGLLMLGVVALLVANFQQRPSILVAWIAVMLIVFAAFAIRARSLRKPAYYFLAWTVTSPLIIRGLLMKPRTESEFPDIHEQEITR